MLPAMTAFSDHFATLEDTRDSRKLVHSVAEILLVTLCGVVAGADGFGEPYHLRSFNAGG